MAAPKKGGKAAPKKGARKTTKKGKKRAPKKKPPASAKDFLAAVQRDDDEAATFFSDHVFSEVTERLPTGVLAIDQIMGGGWPVGRLVEVAAWEGIGKSTLLDQSIAEMQRAGGRTALIDTEGARDLTYMHTLGVDTSALMRLQADTIEGCFVAIERCLDAQAYHAQTEELLPMLIVWDSIAGTPTKAELEGSAEDSHVMTAARVIKLNLRRLHHRLAPLRTAIVCTNHFYRTIGPFSSLKAYGGSGIQYFASLRLWLTNKGQLKIGTQVVGHQVEAKIKKTRLEAPRPPVLAGLVHGRGFDNSFSLFEWATEHGAEGTHRYVSRHGAWYTFTLGPDDPEPVTFQKGFAGFGQLLSERPAVYAELVKRYLQDE